MVWHYLMPAPIPALILRPRFGWCPLTKYFSSRSQQREMPKLLPFKKSSHQSYSVSDSSFLVHVKLLDGSDVDLSLPLETKGGECLERVAAYLNLREMDYFGLQFQSKHGSSLRWVEREAVLKKHLTKFGRVSQLKPEGYLTFGVQYFTNNIGALTDEIARFLFYLELRRDILQGRLLCQTNMSFKLASFALQADLGDFSPERHTHQFIEDIDLIPEENLLTENIHDVVEKVKKLYQRNKGLSSDGAVQMYLKSAMQLPEYGHQGFEAQDGRGHRISIGTCFVGMFVKHYNGRPAMYFKWPDIHRMKVKDRNLVIETATEEIFFRLEDKEMAKYALRQMSSQHQFYSNELRKSSQRTVRSRSAEPVLYRHRQREAVVADRRHGSMTPTGSPQKKKGKFHSPSEVEAVLGVRPPTPDTPDGFAVADVMAPPLATTYHSHSHTTDVEVHPSPSLPPLGRKLDSPKREGPIQKLVTVVRRDSSKSPGAGKRGAAHQIEDANFADVPAHDEAPMTQKHKVSPMISKYVPRNLRESISVNGFGEKGNSVHPSFLGLSREQWSGHKELELTSTDKPTSGPSPPGDREECVAELQIDIGSASSQSGSVSPMSVPVVTREGRPALDQSLPHLQRDPEKDGDTMFHEAFSFDSPQVLKPLYVTESVALSMDESTADSQQQERLATSRPEVETFAEGAYELKHANDALGPVPTLLPLEEEVTECAELSFSDTEGGEEETRDPEDDSDTDIDLEEEDSVEEKEMANNERPVPSSLPLQLEACLLPLGQHYLLDHPSEVEEVDFAAPCKKHKLVEMLEDKLQSGSLIKEYTRIPKIRVDAKVSAATSSRNIYRNRYRDILPYNDNRVQLNPSNNLASTDYINASYVNFTAGSTSKQYIVSQGPLPHTSTDFWQMVWEHDVKVVVMVTNAVEGGRQKCHQYFPSDEGGQVQFEQYRITCTKATGEEVICTRELQVRHIPSGKALDLVHLHFTDWPDHGAPQDPSSFVELIRQMRHYQSFAPSTSTTVVHCSAGVGRSGVAVLMDLLIERFFQALEVDIQKSLRELRRQRMYLVQTPVQYVFVHYALLEYLQSWHEGSANESDC